MSFKGPKVKLSRKLGIKLTPKAAKYMEKRPYPPGQHGKTTGRKKSTDYKSQLLEKQRLKFQYNVSERQLRNYYEKAKKMPGVTGDNLIGLLERRLDALVLRSGLVNTIFAARQVVTHGHFIVNGKKVTFPSTLIKPGDKVWVKEKSRKMKLFHDSIKVNRNNQYVSLDKPKLEFVFNYLPTRAEIPVICELHKVIEYYSK